MNFVKHILLFTVLLASASASAETWSLDRCIDHAMTHNISVRQSQLRVDEGRMAITEAKDRFLPNVDGGMSESFSFGRGLTSNNTYENRNTTNTGWNIGMSVPLFQGTAALRRVKIAELSLQQYVWENESTKDNIALNIMSQYLQVLYAKETAKSARSQAEYSEFEVERQRALIESGKVAEATLYDIEALAAQDRLQVVTSDNEVRTALITLANLLQLENAVDFDIEEGMGEPPVLMSPEDVYAAAMGLNNTLKGARQSLKVAEENIGLAKTGFIPTLSLSAGIGSSYYTVSGFQSESFGQQMRHNFSPSIGLSLRVPIFDAFSTRNSIRRAKLQKLNAELTLEQRESDLYKDIQLAFYQALGAKERSETASETLEKTRLSFETTKERFNLGRATIADYEQAKNNLYKTEISQIQARFEYLLRARILEFYRTNSWN